MFSIDVLGADKRMKLLVQLGCFFLMGVVDFWYKPLGVQIVVLQQRQKHVD